MSTILAVGIKDAAVMIGLSHWTLRQWIIKKKIRSVKIGRRVLIEPSELERLVETGRRGGSDGRKK